jgi:hypothetical protein
MRGAQWRWSRRLSWFKLLALEAKVESRTGPVLLSRACEYRLKRRSYRRVELTFDSLSQAHPSYLARHRITVRPIRRHGVIGVRNGNDP